MGAPKKLHECTNGVDKKLLLSRQTPINLSQEALARVRDNYPAIERFVLRDDASG
jgi:hypothetical protein